MKTRSIVPNHLSSTLTVLVALAAVVAFAAPSTRADNKKDKKSAAAASQPAGSAAKASTPSAVSKQEPTGPAPTGRANGSLFSEDAANLELSSDFKASRVGDLLFITVIESNTASVSSNAKNSRDAGPVPNAVMNAIPFPAEAAGVPGVITALGTRQFTGSGTTGRQSTITAGIAARVVEVLPNGDLKIAAEKLIKINKEDETLTLTGIVRRRDLLQDSAIPSTSIADLKVKLNGKGVASENNGPGWLARILGKISPF